MTKRIIPKSGLIVRDPVTKQPIPPEGIDVSEDDRYWLRRERDGDVRAEAKEQADDKAEADDKSKPQDVERI